MSPQRPNGVAAAPSLPPLLRARAKTFGELLAEVEDEDRRGGPRFAVRGLMEPGDVVLLTGEEKRAFKTFLLIDLAICRIVGGQWLGFDVVPCPDRHVLIVETETSPRQMARRMRMLCKGRGIDIARVKDLIVVDVGPLPIIPPGVRSDRIGKVLRGRPDLGRLALEQDMKWGLIGVDSLRDNLLGDENSSEDGRAYMEGARYIARRADCPLVSNHHTAKAKGSGARVARGTTELTAGPDALLTIDVDDDSREMQFLLRNHESPPLLSYAVQFDKAKGSARIVLLEGPDAADDDGDGVSEDDVLDVLSEAADGAEDGEAPALSESNIRKKIAEARGGKPGSKASAKLTRKALAALKAKGRVVDVEIKPTNGKPFPGWRVGTSRKADKGRPELASRERVTPGRDPAELS